MVSTHFIVFDFDKFCDDYRALKVRHFSCLLFFYVKRYRHSYFCLNDRFVASIDYRVGLLLMPYCFGVPSYRVMIQLLYCIFLQSLYFRLAFLFCSLCCDSRWHCHHEINRLSYDNKLTLNTSPVLKFRLIDAILSVPVALHIACLTGLRFYTAKSLVCVIYQAYFKAVVITNSVIYISLFLYKISNDVGVYVTTR